MKENAWLVGDNVTRCGAALRDGVFIRGNTCMFADTSSSNMSARVNAALWRRRAFHRRHGHWKTTERRLFVDKSLCRYQLSCFIRRQKLHGKYIISVCDVRIGNCRLVQSGASATPISRQRATDFRLGNESYSITSRATRLIRTQKYEAEIREKYLIYDTPFPVHSCNIFL